MASSMRAEKSRWSTERSQRTPPRAAARLAIRSDCPRPAGSPGAENSRRHRTSATRSTIPLVAPSKSRPFARCATVEPRTSATASCQARCLRRASDRQSQTSRRPNASATTRAPSGMPGGRTPPTIWKRSAASGVRAETIPTKPTKAAPAAIRLAGWSRRVRIPVSIGRAALLLQQDPVELVLLVGLEDREHPVAGVERRGANGDLRRIPVHDGDQAGAVREVQLVDPLADRGGLRVDLDLVDEQVLLLQLEEVDQVLLRHLVLDERHDRGGRADRRADVEHVEVALVARVVHARDQLRDAVLLLRELADHEVVLVVAGDREDEIGGPLDPRGLEDVELGRIAVVHV